MVRRASPAAPVLPHGTPARLRQAPRRLSGPELRMWGDRIVQER